MNVYDLIKAMKSNAKGLLWVNCDRRKATYHDGRVGHSVPYKSAAAAAKYCKLPAFDKSDGTTYAAVIAES